MLKWNILKEGKVYLFCRAEDNTEAETFGMSRIGLAVSEDGTYIMTYTSWDKKVERLCIATSKDLINWTKQGPAIGTCKASKYKDPWSKSGSIVCRQEGGEFIATKINGKYWMYFGDTGFLLAFSNNLTDWNVLEDDTGKPLIVLPQRPGMFDSLVVEPAPPALLTDQGIFMIYNGGKRDRPDLGLTGTIWVMAQVLFDNDDPIKVLGRTNRDFSILSVHMRSNIWA